MAITPPKMQLRFQDVINAAQRVPPIPANHRIFYHLSSRWGLGLVAAASVAVAVVAGMLATGGFSRMDARSQKVGVLAMPDTMAESEPPAHLNIGVQGQPAPQPEGAPVMPGSLVRTGSLRLKHEKPGDAYMQVTALVTILGGFVTRLTRQGAGEDATVELEVAIPSEKFSEFTVKAANMGEVVSQTESAADVAGQQIDLKARLAEAEAYLKRLDALSDKQHTASDLANYERQRREVSLEIERYRLAIAALDSRVNYARLNLSIAAKAPDKPEVNGELAQAWQEGVEGLERTSAFMVRTGVAGSPLLLAGALVYLALRRKRRKAEAA
ncbi:MAG: DUF4349 domain-containing protein [Planctomycetes bacterium]|nr:DUF4349 domain-containing protein [Planctomycetota bacterium]MCW8135964.1 DUF4349 domain-containing protein [Planctomycetota bacterium]